jgi:excisionase family DNA binding protein
MSESFCPIDWLTTAEAAKLTGYHVRYLRQLINDGKIQAIKRGGIFWIDKENVQQYANEMKRLGPAKHDPWRIGARRKSEEAD